jgi:dTDP-4-dehydrorhamnose 3,5-epimerase
MKAVPTTIPDVVVLEPKVFEDARGFFFESYNERELNKELGFPTHFVQDNHSRSGHNVLRGLHYQVVRPQGKLVRVIEGEIFDVAVDIRTDSSTFGQWTGQFLSAENRKMMWIPAGFAHGFAVVSDWAEVLYKTTDYYEPSYERGISWDDADLGIQWPLTEPPILSDKDRAAVSLKMASFE